MSRAKLFWLFQLILLLLFGGSLLYSIEKGQQGVARLFQEASEMAQSGENNRAIEQLTTILVKDPGNRSARKELARLLAGKAKSAVKDRPISSKERRSIVQMAYNHLKKTNPEIIERMITQAGTYERQRYYVLACKIYIQLIASSGLQLETKYTIEKRLRAASDKTNAKIESIPQGNRGLYRDAFTLMSVGDWEESLDTWKQYAQRQPADDEIQILINSPEAKKILKEKSLILDAQLAIQVDDLNKARSLYEEALKAAPGNSDAMDGLKDLEERQERRKKKLLIAETIRKAEELLKRGKEDDAFSLLLATLKDDPENPDILGLLQAIQKSSKHKRSIVVQQPIRERPTEKADAPAKAAVERSASKAETHYQRGLVYYGMRNFKDSLTEWEVALKYDPTHRKAARALERVRSDLKADQ